MFEGFDSAIRSEVASRDADRAKNEEVLAALPQSPPRDSINFWRKICRQYSGAHILDSGMYGRMHSAPLAEHRLTAHFHDGEFEYVATDLPSFLHESYDAGNEVAAALETIMYWLYETVHPETDWGDIAERLLNDIEAIERGEMLSGLNDIPSEIDAALKIVWEAGPLELDDTNTFYTYNHENNLNQDYVCGVRYVGEMSYVALRTHNGADARGGFSKPVIAAITEGWPRHQVAYCCEECDDQWEGDYSFRRALAEVEEDVPFFQTDADISEGTCDADEVKFLCPYCVEYTVRAE